MKLRWLERAPREWSSRKLRDVAWIQNSNVDKKAEKDEIPVRLCNYTDIYYNDRITDDLDFTEATVKSSELRKFSLQPGDVIFTKDSESWNDIAVPAVVGEDIDEVVCGYHLTMLRPYKETSGRFLFRCLQANGIREQFWVGATGVTRYGLSQDVIKNVVIPFPSHATQLEIADFLDRKTAAINAVIEKKERLIEVLEQKRASLIHRAVTRGLDPDVPMKDSGIPWIGEIPEHWEVIRFGYVLKDLAQGWSPSAEDRQRRPGEWAVMKLNAVKAGSFDPQHHKTLPESLKPKPDLVTHQGDLLVTRANTPQLVGDSCVVESAADKIMISDLIYRLRLNAKIASPSFVDFFLRSPRGRLQITKDSRGSSQSMVKISQSQIRDWQIPLPPIDEQRNIAQTLDSSQSKLAAAVARIQTQINRLREYRQSLITTAVTGQLDVNEAA